MKNNVVLITYYFEEELAEMRRWSATWKRAAKEYRTEYLRICNSVFMNERDSARQVARRLLRERDEAQSKYSLSLEQLEYWMSLYELTEKERDEARENHKSAEKDLDNLAETLSVARRNGIKLREERDEALAQVEILEAENTRLRKALEKVEWVPSVYRQDFDECPWCRTFTKHKPDCPRQIALGLAKEEA